jgi:hypothetical protein
MSSRTAAVVALLFAPGSAGAEPAKMSLTPDQQIVAAAAVDDAFPRPRHLESAIVLCLDVRAADDPRQELAPPPPPRHEKHKRPRAPDPPPSAIRGAPPELLARLTRPWRPVVSAQSCRLDPRQAYTLEDGRTLARLVTVRVGTPSPVGALRVEWAGGTSAPPSGVQSRDCTATRGPRGWTVRCGGTWSD